MNRTASRASAVSRGVKSRPDERRIGECRLEALRDDEQQARGARRGRRRRGSRRQRQQRSVGSARTLGEGVDERVRRRIREDADKGTARGRERGDVRIPSSTAGSGLIQRGTSAAVMQ